MRKTNISGYIDAMRAALNKSNYLKSKFKAALFFLLPTPCPSFLSEMV